MWLSSLPQVSSPTLLSSLPQTGGESSGFKLPPTSSTPPAGSGTVPPADSPAAPFRPLSSYETGAASAKPGHSTFNTAFACLQQLSLLDLKTPVLASSELTPGALASSSLVALLRSAGFGTSATEESRALRTLQLLIKYGPALRADTEESSGAVTSNQACNTLPTWLPLFLVTCSQLDKLQGVRSRRKSFKERRREQEERMAREQRALFAQFNECFITSPG